MSRRFRLLQATPDGRVGVGHHNPRRLVNLPTAYGVLPRYDGALCVWRPELTPDQVADALTLYDAMMELSPSMVADILAGRVTEIDHGPVTEQAA